MLESPLPPSFLDTYSLSTSSLRCNALCMVISFLLLWSISLSSFLVHLRKGPEYLTRGTAQVEFFTSALAEGLSLKFEYRMSPQVSRTLLSILANLNNVVVWMVSTRPLISKFSSPFYKHSLPVPKSPLHIIITIIIIIILWVFGPAFSHWCLSESKSRQVSTTLHSILHDLNYAEVWMYSTWLYFHALQSLYRSFRDCTMSRNYYWYHRHFYVPQVFQFHSKIQILIFPFSFFQIYSVVSRDNKAHNVTRSLFFVDYYYIWSYGRNLMICSYFKISEESVLFILHVGFWGWAFTISSYGEISISWTIPMDLLAHPVVSSLMWRSLDTV